MANEAGAVAAAEIATHNVIDLPKRSFTEAVEAEREEPAAERARG